MSRGGEMMLIEKYDGVFGLRIVVDDYVVAFVVDGFIVEMGR